MSMDQSQHYVNRSISFEKIAISIDTLKRSIYDFSSLFDGEICEDSKRNRIIVNIFYKHELLDDIENIIVKFKQSVQDHQIASDIESEYRLIREIIVAQAFQPCENLKEILQKAKI